MHGNSSNIRVCVCVLEVCAARDSPVTSGFRHRINETSAAKRRTSRDHDLSKSARRRSALQHLDAVRPEYATERGTSSTRAAC